MAIQPFLINVPAAAIRDLSERLARSHFTEPNEVAPQKIVCPSPGICRAAVQTDSEIVVTMSGGRQEMMPRGRLF
jgi:hypothetical protein